MKILDRYVFREVCVSFFFCFAIFLITGLIAGFLPILQKGMESGLELTMILFQALASALPGTLVTVSPLSISVGILLGLGRMASDNEISAIKSSGISIVRLLPPVLALGFLGFFLSLLCTLFLIPKGISEGKRLMQEALTKRLDVGIEERAFFNSLKNMILYVDQVDSSNGLMNRIFIRESSQPNDITTIIAKKGKVATDPEGKAFIMDLRDGVILKEDSRGDSTGSLAFKSYTFKYPLNRMSLEKEQKSLEEMSISEILQRVSVITAPKPQDTEQLKIFKLRVDTFARILILQRFVYPFSCIALALISFPIGLVSFGKGKLNNVSLGLIAIFVYYALTLAAERAARSYLVSPEIAVPFPPLLFVAASVYLIDQVRRERAPAFSSIFEKLLIKFGRR
ncbi:MAG: LptF/LptG family permease [Deltaproteobacteria bacterium]|nr:LptF/LptG family permease [Deltaproteobacteria bacterium]